VAIRFGPLPAIAIAAAVMAGGYFFLVRPSRPADSSPSLAAPASAPTPAPAETQPQSTIAPRPPTGGFGRAMAVIDLNSATLSELETLPSITPEYARKIIAGRPYTSLNDVERTGIPRQVLEQISPPAIIRVNGRGPLPDAPPSPNKKP
jgi:competence protein ComEA